MFNSRLLLICVLPFLTPAQQSGTVLWGSDLSDGFYGEEPPFDVHETPWLGLVRRGNIYTLSTADLEWHRLERLVGADGPTFALSSDPPAPLVLFSEVAGLREGDVEGARPTTLRLSAGSSTAEVRLASRTYEVGLESAYPQECRAVVTLSDGVAWQELLIEGVLGCGDPHFTIHWAGDLDGDGGLDLVATFSMKYSYHPRQLYLSSLAGPEELVALAALTDRTAE